MTSNWTRRALALAALASIAAVLHAAGQVLPTPPADLDQAVRWWNHSGPTVAVATLLRAGSLVACYWLIGVTALDTMAVAVRARPLRRITERLSPRLWRSLVLRPVVVTALATPQVVLPAATMSTAVAQVADTGAPDQHVSTDVTDTNGQVLVMSRPGPVTPAGEAEPSPRTLTMRWHEPDTEPADDPHGDDTPATHASTPSTTHIVQAGENLWSIAASHLASEQGGRPTAQAVAPHWQALIDANRDRLPDPDNPDLVYRGLELRLPPTT
ncbi:MAG: LysM domain-containing protein [Acidimicrobiales bacterium]|nr:LysM domain-containing protein [Acidimicrobiales bacterium]